MRFRPSLSIGVALTLFFPASAHSSGQQEIGPPGTNVPDPFVSTSSLSNDVLSIAPTELSSSVSITPDISGGAESWRIVRRVNETEMSDGSIRREVLGEYTELSSGLQYQDTSGVWRSSVVVPETQLDGAVLYQQLPVKYRFAPVANVATVLEADFGHGVVARSAVAAVTYLDKSSGQSVIIGFVTNAAAETHDNGVYYPDAFWPVHADLVYRVHAWGLEQDIVIYGGLPDPVALDLDPETTVISVLTELMDLPAEDVEISRADSSIAVASDEPLMVHEQNGAAWQRIWNWQRSYAYLSEGQSLDMGAQSAEDTAIRHPVATRIVELSGRTFLSEEIPLSVVLSENAELLSKGVNESALTLRATETPPERPDEMIASKTFTPVKPAADNARLQTPSHPRPFVIDYVTYTATQTTNLLFNAGATYYITNSLVMDGSRLTIEPGAFVKFAKNGQIQFQNGAKFACKSHASSNAIFTSAYDTNVGEAVLSGGAPNTNRYTAGLVFSTGTAVVDGITFKYAKTAVELGSGVATSQWVRHSRFYNCDQGIVIRNGTGTGRVVNCLFTNVYNGVWATNNSAALWNNTFYSMTGIPVIVSGSVSKLDLFNNLFANTTNQLVSTNAVAVAYQKNARYLATNGYLGADLTNSVSPFATGSQGPFYLASPSSLTNAGYSNAAVWGLFHFTTSTGEAKESNSIVDVGFHYPTSSDEDGDGLEDLVEDRSGDGAFATNSGDYSDLTQGDSDEEGLNDTEEFWFGSDPLLADTDGDGFDDYNEYDRRTDPLNPESHSAEINGVVTYSGLQPGSVYIAITTYAPLRSNRVLDMSFPSDTSPTTGTIILDDSPKANHGTASGGPVWMENGVREGAFNLAGESDWLLLGRPAALTSGPTNAFTLSAWISPDSDHEGYLIGRATSGNNDMSWYINDPTGEGIVFTLKAGGSEHFLASRDGGWPDIPNSNWTHVASTYDGTNFRGYINGSNVASTSVVGHVEDNGGQFVVGDRGSFDRNFLGKIDEVLVFDRALASNEIVSLYQGGLTSAMNVVVVDTMTETTLTWQVSGMASGRRYWVSAWRDENDNGRQDLWEPAGTYPTNFVLTNAVTNNLNVNMTDPDNDGDGVADWREKTGDTDPLDNDSHVTNLSGTVTYGGPQTGLIDVVETYEPDLILWYTFDSSNATAVSDWSGLNNTATVESAIWTNGGRSGTGCYHFNSDEGYLNVVRSKSLTTGISNQFTLSAWINQEEDHQGHIIGRARGYYNDWSMYVNDPDGQGVNYTLKAGGIENFLESGSGGYGNLTNGAWVHVAATYNGTQFVGYIGATQVASLVTNLYVEDNANDFLIGNEFQGRIDDVKIYRRGLTWAEISNLYLTGSSTTSCLTNSLASPGGYTNMTLPNLRRYVVSSFRDSNGNGTSDTCEARGGYASNPVFLTNNLTGINVTLTNESTPPALTLPSNRTVECSASTNPTNTGQATATDNCDASPAVAYTDTVVSASCADAASIARRWTATDAFGNVAVATQVITKVDTTAPVFTFIPPDVTNTCETGAYPSVTGYPTATDNCDATSSPPTGSALLWINEFHYDNTDTDEFEFIELAGVEGVDLGNYEIALYSGSDGQVYRTNALSGVITNEGCGYGFVSIEYPVDGIQNETATPDGIALVTNGSIVQFISYEGAFTASNGPAAGLTSVDVGVDEDPPASNGYSLRLTGTGNTYSAFSWASPATNSAGLLNQGQIISPCGNGPQIAHVDTTNGGVHQKIVTRLWTASDNCGNSTTATQHITLLDTNIPTFVSVPSNVTVECDAVPVAWPDVVDDCDVVVTVTVHDVSNQATNGACSNYAYTITRTWTALDLSGNSNTASQIITVQDTTPPVLTGIPADETAPSNAIPAWSAPTALDNCAGSLTVSSNSISTKTANGSCTDRYYTITRTWTATDMCTNTVSATQIITVVDSATPVLVLPSNTTINCSASTSPTNTGQASSDICNSNIVITYTDSTLTNMCPVVIARAWLLSVGGYSNISTQTISCTNCDSDIDGMPNCWEELYGLNPTNSSDRTNDLDADGLNNLTEYRTNSYPNVWDTDGDGLSDGDEAAAGTSPTVAETNALLATINLNSGTNPLGATCVSVFFSTNALKIIAAGTAGSMKPTEYQAGQGGAYTSGSARVAYYQATSTNLPTGVTNLLHVLFRKVGTSGVATAVSATNTTAQTKHATSSSNFVPISVTVTGMPSSLP